MKPIKDYLPETKHAPVVLVQARVDKTLIDRVKEILKKDRITLPNLIRALLQRFVDEGEL